MSLISLKYISSEDLSDKTLMGVAIRSLKPAFAALSRREIIAPERTLIITDEGSPPRQMLTSPVAWPLASSAAVKVTTLTPRKDHDDKALIQGMVLLFDLATGLPRALLDGGALTALRTGATAGLAASLMASCDSAELGVVGAGVQARAAVDAILTVRPIRIVRVTSRSRKRLTDFARWFAGRWGTDRVLEVHDRVTSAIAGAHVVCTATSTDSHVPLVHFEEAPREAFYAIIGGATESACEIDPRLLSSASVVVETRESALADAGEVRAALAGGLLRESQLIELGDLVAGTLSLVHQGCLRVFRSVGHSIEDLAVAAAVVEALHGPGAQDSSSLQVREAL